MSRSNRESSATGRQVGGGYNAGLLRFEGGYNLDSIRFGLDVGLDNGSGMVYIHAMFGPFEGAVIFIYGKQKQ